MSYRIDLPWTKPPLSMNDRMHWRLKAKITREIRDTTRILAIAGHVPKDCRHITVCLHYRPRDNRRRDADNLVPVLKALADGLVDYELVPDDTPDLMTKTMPHIHAAERGSEGALWLTIDIEEEP